MMLTARSKPPALDLSVEGRYVLRTDPHCHILPAIDDGASDTKMAIRMARRAAELGIHRIVATPHACHPSVSGEYHADDIRERVGWLNTLLQREEIPVHILPGMELFADERIPRLFEMGRLLTWADQGRYVLIELGFRRCQDAAWDLLDYFTGLGIVPIIAHPERYAWLPSSLDDLDRLEEMGVWFQVNVMSLNGLWGPAAQALAAEVLSRTERWLIGTDSHNDQDRYWDLDNARAHLDAVGIAWREPEPAPGDFPSQMELFPG